MKTHVRHIRLTRFVFDLFTHPHYLRPGMFMEHSEYFIGEYGAMIMQKLTTDWKELVESLRC